MAFAAGAQTRVVSSAKRAKKLASKDRSARRRGFIAVGVLAFSLIGMVWLHVWLRLQVVHMGYVLSTTSKLQGRLEQENRELKIELATLTSADRLESLARRRLGLKQPEKGQVIVLP